MSATQTPVIESSSPRPVYRRQPETALGRPAAWLDRLLGICDHDYQRTGDSATCSKCFSVFAVEGLLQLA